MAGNLAGGSKERCEGDEGYMLLAVIVLVFLVLLTLSIAAPRIATQLKRDRELETQHRAQQYVRAIRLYYRKFHNYPGSIEQLEKSNNQRFLRQRYVDPLTGKDDWRLINVGQNKTMVKGFFGKDLPGIGGGLGAAAGMAGNGPGGLGGSPIGGSNSAFNNNGVGNSGPGVQAGSPPSNSATPGALPGASGTSPDAGSRDATNATANSGGGGPIMGIGVPASGQAILTVNEKDQLEEWEFLYDPRIEQLYQKGFTQGANGATAGGGLGNGQAPTGAPGQNGASPFGAPPPTPGQNNTPAPGTPPAPNSPGSPQ